MASEAKKDLRENQMLDDIWNDVPAPVPTNTPKPPPVPIGGNASGSTGMPTPPPVPTGGAKPNQVADPLSMSAQALTIAAQALLVSAQSLHNSATEISNSARAKSNQNNTANQSNWPNNQHGGQNAKGGGFLQLFHQKLSGATNIASDAIQNRGSAVVSKGLGSATEMIPGAAGKVATAFVAVADSAIALTNSFVERGKELAKFSGPLAQANANTKVKEMLADIREADELGPQMAKLTDSSTDLWISIRDNILVPIKKAFLDLLVPVVEVMADIMEAIGPYIKVAIEILKAGFESIVAALQFNFSKAVKTLDELPDKVEKAFRKKDKPVRLFEDMVAKTRAMLPTMVTSNAGPVAVPTGLNVPAFQGI